MATFPLKHANNAMHRTGKIYELQMKLNFYFTDARHKNQVSNGVTFNVFNALYQYYSHIAFCRRKS